MLRFLLKAFFLFLMISLSCAGKAQLFQQANADKNDTGRIFIVNAPVKDLREFEQLVTRAKLLTPYGKVKINISTLADKSFHEIPAAGSPWHEYASSNPTPFKFFPDAKLAPFLPAAFIKKNRELILAKAAILRKHGLEAAFLGYEPNFLPAAFFDAYPAMLGPRVDHPRRSTQKEFAPCICVKETQRMYEDMIAEMLKNVPEITTFAFKTNDAGAGICWSDWLYTGANGNSSCKKLSAGERIRTLLNSFKKGASKANSRLSIYLDEVNSNFSAAEKEDIELHLPENCYFSGKNSRSIGTIGSLFGSTYPVKGIIDPVAFLKSAAPLRSDPNSTVFINFRASYDRGLERADMAAFVLGLTEEAMKYNTLAPLQLLWKLSEEWGGAANRQKLFDAFMALNEAQTYKATLFPMTSSLYWGVTMRIINRPLVIDPSLLSKAEESYFLPYIFNVSEQEARMDYMDVHGGRNTVPPGAAENYTGRMIKVARMLESIDDTAPQKDFFVRMAKSLKIYASIIRSCGNFAAAQQIRDRDSSLLNGPARQPSKVFSWTGHPDYILFNNIMRDELDNTQELIQLIETEADAFLVFTKDQRYEDRFILGPDLLNQLKKKRKIMLDHWQDIESYLSSPLK